MRKMQENWLRRGKIVFGEIERKALKPQLF